MFIKLVGASVLSLVSSLSLAQGAPVGTYHLEIGGFSRHIPNNPHNSNNFGPGIKYQWKEDLAFKVGMYLNSNYHTSHYIFATYEPFEVYGIRMGITGGLVDGYPNLNNGKFGRIILPSFSKQFKSFGLTGIYMPKTGDHEGVIFLGANVPIHWFD
jgi:hypothetical protein